MNSERNGISRISLRNVNFEQQLAFAAAKVDLKGSTADPFLASDDESVFAGSDQHSAPGSFRSQEGSGLRTCSGMIRTVVCLMIRFTAESIFV